MLLTVSSFGESLRRLSTGGGVFNSNDGVLKYVSGIFMLVPQQFKAIGLLTFQQGMKFKVPLQFYAVAALVPYHYEIDG